MSAVPRPADQLAMPSARRQHRPSAGRALAVGRVVRDPFVLYTAGLAPVGVLVALLDGHPAGLTAVAVLTPLAIGLQIMLGVVPRRLRPLSATGWSFLRLSVSLLFVAGMVQLVGGATAPMLVLYLPVVVAAAAVGTVPALVIGAVATGIFVLPQVTWGGGGDLGLRGIAMAGATVLLVIGVRRLVIALGSASAEARTAVVAERRRSRQIAGLEAVGQLLIGEELSDALLDRAMALVVERFGYNQVSLWFADGDRVLLVAQHGYGDLPEAFDSTQGVTGRVQRTHEVAFVPNVADDPDYISGLDGVVSEICAPLQMSGQFLGVFNVEATSTLDRTDRDLVVGIAERIASAVALGRERQQLAERARLLRSLHEFTVAIGATLDLDQLCQAIASLAARVVAADAVGLIVLDRPSGRYVVRAVSGIDPSAVGGEILPGEGVSGRAIRDRVAVLDEQVGPDGSPASVRHAIKATYGHVAAVPLIRDKVVVGALTLGRLDADRPFAPLEREGIDLLAGHAALAIANAFLHAEMGDLAIRDPLTGLYNRRYFDEALERILAVWRRARRSERRPVSVITLDIDHFGVFNKQHGHQVGDVVLRAVADVLRTRLRATDLVARLGGEEFVVVLEGAARDQAVQVAEELRAGIAAQPVGDATGAALHVTVSAGCAELDPAAATREQLLRTADVALFMAKRGGRDQVVAA